MARAGVRARFIRACRADIVRRVRRRRGGQMFRRTGVCRAVDGALG